MQLIQMTINRFLLLLFIFLISGIRLIAQDTVVIRSKSFNNVHEFSLRDRLWLFHPETANADKMSPLKLSGWQPVHYTAFGKDNLPPGWNGIGWFALWLRADSGVLNQKLALRINHDGASEIFMDGRPLGGYGRLGHSANDMEAIRAPQELIPIWFNDQLPHLLTIHYANRIGVYPDFYGFQVLPVKYKPTVDRMRHNRSLYQFAPMCAAAGIILGILHLLLYFFYPKRKLNLYYAVFVVLTGINGILIYEYYFTSYPATQYVVDFMMCIVKVLLMWSIECGVTRIQLHRKLKAVVGVAPGEMIRVIRLQYAYELLQRRAATIAEVAYQVGYSNPSSFSSSFSRHFGFPPKMVELKSTDQEG